MKNFFAKMFAVLTVPLLATTFSFAAGKTGMLRDSRDGMAYKTVKIGNQVWMTENLNYRTSASMCYGNNPANCKKFGRLYKWDEALDACPSGWRLPDEYDFQALVTTASKASDSEYASGYVLKSNRGWKSNLNGSDDLSFNAKPAGYFSERNSGFSSIGNAAIFWSAKEANSENALVLDLYDDQFEAGLHQSNKGDGFSVRCVQGKYSIEKNSASVLKDFRDGRSYRTVAIGDQVWMAENLNYVYSPDTNKSVCYGRDSTNCEKYGRLYIWNIAREVCPDGWRLPSKEDFKVLLRAVGGTKDDEVEEMWPTAGVVLKSKDGWVADVAKSGSGTETSGFDALPAGYYISYSDDFLRGGSIAFFWTATEEDDDNGLSLLLDYLGSETYFSPESKSHGISVRCVKN